MLIKFNQNSEPHRIDWERFFADYPDFYEITAIPVSDRLYRVTGEIVSKWIKVQGGQVFYDYWDTSKFQQITPLDIVKARL